MGDIEKKVVTTVMWSVSALIGMVVANKAYNTAMVGYAKLFHKDTYDAIVEQISQ